MTFCTAINCMDGRVQLPVINYLMRYFEADYVDSVTETGPNLILAEQKNEALIQSIITRVKVSVEKHKSVGIAVVGHNDCVGNPAQKEEQFTHLEKSVEVLSQYFNVPIVALWVDENWKVHKI